MKEPSTLESSVIAVPPCPTSLKDTCMHTFIPFQRKKSFFFFLIQNTNIRIYLEILGKIRQDTKKEDTSKGGQVHLGQESRKPDEDVIDLALTRAAQWNKQTFSFLLPPSALSPIGPSKESENKQGIH